MLNSKIAVAVAAVIAAGGATAALAALPTQSQSATTTNVYYLGGSSAAVAGFGAAVGADLCQSGTLATYVTNPANQPTSGVTPTAPKTPDFRAFSCFSNGTAGLSNGAVLTIYYRAEGGSVVGVFAPYNGQVGSPGQGLMVKQLNLATADCVADTHSGTGNAATANQFDCATSNNPGGTAGQNTSNEVVGDSPDNGPADSYTGAVQSQIMSLGFSDVEPDALGNGFGPSGSAFPGGGNNDPNGIYTFLGNDQTDDAFQTWMGTNSHILFQQTFGIVMNTTGTATPTTIGASGISSVQLGAILTGAATDWHQIVSSIPAGTAIVVCHRDLGSGTRTAADIVFNQDGCNSAGTTTPTADSGTVPDSFSTGDVLACVNGSASTPQPNSIGYVSVDNFSKLGSGNPYPNVGVLPIDGVSPTNQKTAAGQWNYAVEATANFNTDFKSNVLLNRIITDLQQQATTPQSAQINAIPTLNGNGDNAVKSTPAAVGGKDFLTSYGRSTSVPNSCTPMHQE